ncbi:DUF6745 domain-containing protein [Actinomadura rubrisoli]|uniref:DUF6745 domain-containing protein n=1 Tax=Actinomadura rubrisoli TaxID=2530368 RepID=UPI001A9E0AB0|nr:hypothetical protein [Actinomadura rubrisoli]
MQREAADIREDWLGVALSTLPADRPAAEAAISGLYRLIGYAPPRFHWVPSPLAAVETVPPGLGPRPAETVERLAEWPVPKLLAALRTALFAELDTQLRRYSGALAQMMHREVRLPLWRTSVGSLFIALRAAHGTPPVAGTGWYTMQCVSQVALYDGVRRAAGAAFTPDQDRRLDLWTTAARSCGLWWPREDVCVISERPVAVHTEVAGEDGEVRLHNEDGPAVRYSDGWDVHVWHGTRVPAWVITDPDVRRIEREGNVEVRRCAIERIGWPSYIERAGLVLLATAPDPGNPGSHLRLYDMRKETRVLLAVNGSVERDGRRRQYGLTVPGRFHDPVAAAGWTYGLSAEQYSQLLRRT